MELTRQADYAVRVVLDLAGQPNWTGRSGGIARRQLIPTPYLRKIVQTLARAGLLRTFRGAAGGVRLVRDPARITLRQVVEAAEGPVRLNRCLMRPGECPLDRVCPVHPVWRRIQDRLIHELDAVTFTDLQRSRPAARRAGGLGRPASAS